VTLWTILKALTLGSLIAGLCFAFIAVGVGFYFFCLSVFPSDDPAPLVPDSDDPLITNP
jgi:hypothetical protein